MRFAVLVLGVVLAALGCGGGGTSLDGPFDCYGLACTSGEVCLSVAGGIDAGNDIPTGHHACQAVPRDCEIVDCAGNMCSTCIQKLCEPTYVDRVSGRDVSCYGQ
jgi:hypothetical protein